MRPTGKVTPLVCPRCSGRIAASDVNLDLMVGLCHACDATVELSAGDRTSIQVRERPPEALARLAQPPAGIQVASEGQKLVLTRRWFALTPQFLFLALFCMIWDGFLVVWYSIGLASLASGSGEALMMLLFPMLHVAAGVFLTYSLLATLVNRSRIEVDASHIRVTHGPLPWGGPNPIPVNAIDQLYLVRATGKNNQTTGFDLVARRLDRTSDKLLGGLDSDVQARFLEQRMEAHLGLDDVEVEGEYTG